MLYCAMPSVLFGNPSAASAGRFVREFLLTWPILLSILAIVLLFPLLYRGYYNLKNMLRPANSTGRTREWLQLMYATISADEAEFSMAAFARKYPVRPRAHCGIIHDIQWRVYLNLQYIRRQLKQTPARTIALIPASLWLFDNYNLIYREIKRLQGSGSLRPLSRLPLLTVSSRRCYPRIYLIAHKIISGTNGHIREESLIRMLCDYQKEQELTSRELWALPHVLTLCLLERIVEEAIRLLQGIRIRTQADATAERVAAALCRGSQETSAILQQDNFWNKTSSQVFLAHFMYRLRTLSVDETEIVRWLASLSGVSTEEYQQMLFSLVMHDRQREALAESTVSALIRSLKEIGELNWEESFREISLCESSLELDPAQVYSRMDINTRARYRHSVEKLARRFRIRESAVAAKAVQLARLGAYHVQAGATAANTDAAAEDISAAGTRFSATDAAGGARANTDSPPPAALSEMPGIPWDQLPVPDHVGTYLVGRGRSLLADFIASRPFRPLEPNSRGRAIRSLLYFTSITTLTGLQLWLAWAAAGAGFGAGPAAAGFGAGPAAAGAFLACLAVLAIGIGILLTHVLFTHIIKPKPQLAMDFQESIPDAFRTFVVMPVILGSAGSARSYAERLEKHFLANRQDNLSFAILGDLRDAPTETAPDDFEILTAATEAVQALNDRYPTPQPRFLLLTRRRRWNESERSWMSWERKRGKLEELNALLSGEPSVSFQIRVGSPESLSGFRFVFTLDADTELVRDSANMMVGILAHPLNRPVIDPRTSRIVSGYAIVQSEVSARISDTRSSVFSRVFAGDSGIDTYASVVSDIYQDAFGEGIFIGKGIYDFRIMHQLLRGMIRENTVLSHDLLESSLTRCAFASGIRLLDSTPPNFAAFARRDHRWIRGDWQLLPWIFSRSPVNWLSRWKMLDNLRRSLTPVAGVGAILLNVWLFPAHPWLWLPFVLFGDAFQFIVLLSGTLLAKLRNPSVRVAFQLLGENAGDMLVQAALYVIFLPFRAWLSLDAVIRTLFRMAITRRHLLEWQTSESVEQSLRNTLPSYIRLLLPSLAVPLLLGAAAWLQAAGISRALLLTLAGFWLAAPWFAWRVSQPPRTARRRPLAADDERDLRVLARLTWRFFEDFTTRECNWLCPDNFQLFPGPRLSDKTSPTNIGMQLLSALSACDFGYLTLRELADHCDRVLQTVQRMAKWNGHLYNWYQVESLELLWPHYVSVVDSGNFLTALLTLKNGLLDLSGQPLFGSRLVQGLRDTLAAAGLEPAILKGSLASEAERERLFATLEEAAGRLAPDNDWLKAIKGAASALHADLELFARPNGPDPQLSLKQLADLGQPAAAMLLERIHSLCRTMDCLVRDADFKSLYDAKHRLFNIGYNVSTQSAESGHYDLLASEARTASFLAIAKGDVPQRHWFALGRPLTLVRGLPALVSWSGTMFEYLMPNLILRTPHGTLIERSCRAAVIRQITHGRRHGIPWGISESQHFLFDVNSNYRYMAFGMQYLRLQSSMRPARVVAPYATVLALPVKPDAAIRNLRRLRDIGALGRYGMFESLDFSRPNAASLKEFSLVQSFMAHHQGMIMASLSNFLNGWALQRRFHMDPMVKATEVLLEEKRSPVLVLLARYGYSINIDQQEFQEKPVESRSITELSPAIPEAHVLSNGRYLLMLTSDGQGFSRCGDIMVNRWRPEWVGQSHGQFIYVRSIESGQVWSSAYHPTLVHPDEYQTTFSADKVEFHRRDGLITTRTDITLSPLENFELRRVTFSNQGDRPAVLEATSYLEVVNDRYLAEASHPAFNKLFLEMAFIREGNVLLADRRPRSPDEKPGCVLHMVRTAAPLLRAIDYETDRRAFLGRGGSTQLPQALRSRLPLSGRPGFANDPILSLRATVRVPAGQSVSLTFITAWCPDRDDALRLSRQLHRSLVDDDIFRQAQTSSILERKYLNLTSSLHNAIQSLVGPLFFPTRVFRDDDAVIQRNSLGQSGLWRFGISGDDPIILMRVRNLADLPAVRDALAAYEFLRQQTVKVDLVLLNEEAEGYSLPLHNSIMELTSILKIYSGEQRKPSLFVLRRSQMSPEESTLLSTVARMVINPHEGIYRSRRSATALQSHRGNRAILLPDGLGTESQSEDSVIRPPPQTLEFFNGIGGFGANGSEYEIWPAAGRSTPAPWVNVLANPSFGCLVSETGAGYTWAENSRENKLTTWSNDPVTDPASEAIYIRDRESGAITTPVALQPGRGHDHHVRHGFGYSVFAHDEIGLDQSLTIFVAAEAPLKLSVLTLRNTSGRARRLSVIHYAEWVLGVLREQTAPYVVTHFDEHGSLFLARNVYVPRERQKVAFLYGSEPVVAWTGDRSSFLGQGSSICYPGGLATDQLDGATGAGYDPCGAIQMDLSLADGESRTIVLGLGQAANAEEASRLTARFRTPAQALAELDQVRAGWERILGQARVQSSDRAMDLLLNGWLLYQTLSCRLLARSAFYQSGGAIGFRDQLQDTLALLHGNPEIAAAQIRLCSAHQFLEGDVLHWWHPDSGSGVRTRISDDLLFLPYVAAAYIEHTGSTALLNESAPYLDGEPLKPDEHERLFAPTASDHVESIYQHCLRAIEHASRFGSHGLPLMGGGDWNDGMNRVGIEGRGESVWLAWFFYTVLTRFAPVCRKMNDPDSASRLESMAGKLRESIEANAWDGRWYLRAWFDDGTPMGSHFSEECQIDSISQSWSALSGAGSAERVRQALDSAGQLLVHRDVSVIQLLTPPFNTAQPDPGYIRGYYPGIRENGGQYTHAAVWLAMGYARAGRGSEAAELLALLNPIRATSTTRDMMRYEREPYVMAADIYMGEPFTGKGGWSWYTGSAGWMYQALLQSLLGIRRAGDHLVLDPATPAALKQWSVDYRAGGSLYRIRFENPGGAGTRIANLTLDGKPVESDRFFLLDDDSEHQVTVVME